MIGDDEEVGYKLPVSHFITLVLSFIPLIISFIMLWYSITK